MQYTDNDITNQFNEYLQDNEDIKIVTFEVIDDFITWLHYDITDNLDTGYTIEQLQQVHKDIIRVLTKRYKVVA